jgi:hypothetical protein
MSKQREHYCIAIVGGGPRATYACERLAAEVGRARPVLPIHLHVYELSGEFGAGRVHDSRQSATNLLNRTCRQVGFAADETVSGVGPLRPRAERPSLDAWCRARFEQTARPEFDIGPDAWPQRRVGGLALREMFELYLSQLSQAAHVEVYTHAEAVTGMTRDERGRFVVRSEHGTHCAAHQVLLVTGHPTTESDKQRRAFPGLEKQTFARYVPVDYPFGKGLDDENSGPDRVVGVSGMGLTAIDQILNLTEARGGRFEVVGDDLVYVPSGREPKQLLAFSPSGMFPHARPENFKEQGPRNLEHQGRFFTVQAVERLRVKSSAPRAFTTQPRHGARIPRSGRLSFERELMPLIQLEMAYVFYRTLFGDDAGRFLAERAMPVYERFLSAANRDDTPGWLEALLRPIEEGVDEIARQIGRALTEGLWAFKPAERLGSSDWSPAFRHWLGVVIGEERGQAVWQALERGQDPACVRSLLAESPYGLDTRPEGNRFDFERIYDALDGASFVTPEDYAAQRLAHMRRDLQWAAQGNVRNPYKAATDGVWRDLRGVLNHAVDNEGLTVDSYEYFMGYYRRVNNKLSNGPGAVAIKKMCALIACGLLDISAGPGASAQFDAEAGRFRVSSRTGVTLWLDTLLEGHVPPFHAERNGGAVYQELIGQGLARLWKGERADGTSYVPGFLDLSPRFHPLDARAEEVRALTVFGPAATLCNFFQFSLLRPNCNHVIMREIGGWLAEVWDDYEERAAALATTEGATVTLQPMPRLSARADR